MQAYWLTFTDGSEGCCEGENEYDAKVIAEKFTGKAVVGGKFRDFAVKTLPYPARPVIWQHDHPCNGKCPAFCHQPKQCAGKTACPRPHACDN
jgi:hypothetical protein